MEDRINNASIEEYTLHIFRIFQ